MKMTIAGIPKLRIGKINGRGPDIEADVASPQISRVRSLWDLLLSRPWVVVLSLVCLVYAATFYILPGRISGVLAAQVIVPGLWLLVAGATYFLARREGKGHLVFTKKLLWIGVLVGTFQVALFIIAGLFLGFGNSPYASNVGGMLTNLFIVGSLLVGMEFSRAYLMSVLGKKRLMLTLSFLAVLFALLLIAPARYTSLNNPEDVMQLTGRFILPDISESLLATFLAFLGGPIAAIAYRGVLTIFEWYSPILPNLPWLAIAFIGTLAPMIGFLVVQGLHMPATAATKTVDEPKPAEGKRRRRIYLLAWVAAPMVVLLLFLSLNAGFLGFKSIVVLTGSMSPDVGVGDIVITRVTPVQELEVGNIVHYNRNGTDIIHRITDIKPDGSGFIFTTKGDANNSIDRPGPTPSEIKGKVVLVIPKVGRVSMFFRNLLGN